MLRTTFLLILAFAINSCSNEVGSSNQNLDELINTKDKSVVRLDNNEILSLRPDLVINSSKIGSDQVIGRPVSSVITDQNILIADQIAADIKMFDLNGQYIQSIGKKGKGPGEFGFLKDIAANKKYLFATDLSNQRMQIFDHRGRLVETKKVSISLFSTISVGHSNIFIPSNPEENNILTVYQAQKPFGKRNTFMPLVIPRGKQPKGYNNIKSATNKNGKLVVSYPALPYLFIFNESLEHIHTIVLAGKQISAILDENPPPKPVPELKEPMVKNIIGPLTMDQNGTIFLGIGRTGFIVDNKKGNYELSKTFQIDASEVADIYTKPLGLYEFSLNPDGDFLIHISPHHDHVFGFDTSNF